MDSNNQPGGDWQYRPELSDRDQQSLTPGLDPQLQSVKPRQSDVSNRSVQWTASEFIAHEKSFGWYVVLAGGAIVLAALAYLLTRDFITAGFIVVAAALFGVEAGRKPRQVSYEINDHGLKIGDRFLPFNGFRSFSVIEEGAFATIVFLPLKRFGTLTSAYLDPKDEDAILAIVTDQLPFEERGHDLIDRVMRRIRF